MSDFDRNFGFDTSDEDIDIMNELDEELDLDEENLDELDEAYDVADYLSDDDEDDIVNPKSKKKKNKKKDKKKPIYNKVDNTKNDFVENSEYNVTPEYNNQNDTEYTQNTNYFDDIQSTEYIDNRENQVDINNFDNINTAQENTDDVINISQPINNVSYNQESVTENVNIDTTIDNSINTDIYNQIDSNNSSINILENNNTPIEENNNVTSDIYINNDNENITVDDIKSDAQNIVDIPVNSDISSDTPTNIEEMDVIDRVVLRDEYKNNYDDIKMDDDFVSNDKFDYNSYREQVTQSVIQAAEENQNQSEVINNGNSNIDSDININSNSFTNETHYNKEETLSNYDNWYDIPTQATTTTNDIYSSIEKNYNPQTPTTSYYPDEENYNNKVNDIFTRADEYTSHSDIYNNNEENKSYVFNANNNDNNDLVFDRLLKNVDSRSNNTNTFDYSNAQTENNSHYTNANIKEDATIDKVIYKNTNHAVEDTYSPFYYSNDIFKQPTLSYHHNDNNNDFVNSNRNTYIKENTQNRTNSDFILNREIIVNSNNTSYRNNNDFKFDKSIFHNSYNPNAIDNIPINYTDNHSHNTFYNNENVAVNISNKNNSDNYINSNEKTNTYDIKEDAYNHKIYNSYDNSVKKYTNEDIDNHTNAAKFSSTNNKTTLVDNHKNTFNQSNVQNNKNNVFYSNFDDKKDTSIDKTVNKNNSSVSQKASNINISNRNNTTSTIETSMVGVSNTLSHRDALSTTVEKNNKDFSTTGRKENKADIFSADKLNQKQHIDDKRKVSNPDKNNNNDNRLKDKSDISKEETTTEIASSKEKEHNFHSFKRETLSNISQYAQNGGSVVIRSVKNSVVNNEGKEGVDKSIKYLNPLVTSLSIVGLAATASNYKDHVKNIAKTGKQVDKLLNSSHLNISDLNLDKKDLKKQLKSIKIDGAKLESSTIKSIVKNKDLIHNMYGIRNEIHGTVLNLDPALKKALDKKNFFNMNKKQSRELLQLYFNNSTDDTLRNVFGHGRYTNMTKKDFKKFIKKFDKNEVSLNGRSAVKLAEMLNKQDTAKNLLNRKVMMNLNKGIRSLARLTIAVSPELRVGLEYSMLAYRISSTTSKATAKVLIGTRRHGYKGIGTNALRLSKKILIGTKKGGYKGLLSIATKQTLNLLRYTDNMIFYGTHGKFSFTQLNYKISSVVKAGTKAVKNTTAKAITKVANTKAVKKANVIKNKTLKTQKKIANKVKNRAAKIAQSKIGKATKIASKSAARTVKTMAKPVAFAGKATKKIGFGLSKVFSFFNKVKKFIVISIFVIVIAFMALLLLMDGFLSVAGGTEETVSTVMLYDEDNNDFIKSTIQRMVDKFNSRKDDAVAIGKGTPGNTSVYAGHTIDKYGYPADNSKTYTDGYGHVKDNGNWQYGYKIYYKDMDSNILTDTVNNVKDVMSCTYTYNNGEFFYDESLDSALFYKTFNELNPKISNDDIDISDIYTCDDGCETVYYKCNDSATLDAGTSNTYVSNSSIKSDKQNGAKFYRNIITNTNGDKNVTTCNGHDHGQKIYDANKPHKDCDNYMIVPYDNNSKYLSVCLGHKDSIFTTSHGIMVSEKKYEAPSDDCTNYKKIKMTTKAGKVFYVTECNGHSYNIDGSEDTSKTDRITYHGSTTTTIGKLAGCDNFSVNIDTDKKQITLTCLKTGGITHNHGTRTNNSKSVTPPSNGISVCNNYTTTWYCTGHSVKACYGHRDVSIYIPVKFKEDFYDKHNVIMDDEHKEWCDTIYNADWYKYYETDPLGGAGFNVDSSFDDEQMQEIIKNNGNVSALRQNILVTALSQVGQIPYYYGGKPKNAGTPIKTNVGIAGATASTKDHKGRTTAGLDCFGFCQWVYWTASGNNILPEGSSASTTAVFNSNTYGNLVNIDASQLQIGDLGFQAGHVGIFAGFDENGKMMWVHCNGGANTVSYQAYTKFTRYYRLKGLE